MLSRALQVAIWTCLATAGVAFAAPVGGEPTLQFDRCDRFIAPCGDPVVVGKARFYDGRYEWVAMDVADGICFYTEVINRFSGSGSGGCGPKVRPPGGKPLGAGWHGPGSGPGAHGPKATHIGGPARLGVARIRLTVRKGASAAATGARSFESTAICSRRSASSSRSRTGGARSPVACPASASGCGPTTAQGHYWGPSARRKCLGVGLDSGKEKPRRHRVFPTRLSRRIEVAESAKTHSAPDHAHGATTRRPTRCAITWPSSSRTVMEWYRAPLSSSAEAHRRPNASIRSASAVVPSPNSSVTEAADASAGPASTLIGLPLGA